MYKYYRERPNAHNNKRHIMIIRAICVMIFSGLLTVFVGLAANSTNTLLLSLVFVIFFSVIYEIVKANYTNVSD